MPDSLTEWLAVGFASWLILSLVSVTALSFATNRLKRATARLCSPPPPEPDAAWLLPEPVEPSSWTYIPVDLPSVPLSWAEQEALNAIERREFSGGAAA